MKITVCDLCGYYPTDKFAPLTKEQTHCLDIQFDLCHLHVVAALRFLISNKEDQHRLAAWFLEHPKQWEKDSDG